MKVVLPNDTEFELPDGASGLDAARAIGPKLAEQAVLVRTYAKADDPKFERAAVRWLQQRLADGGLMLDETRVACEWLAALRGPDADLAAGSLGKLAYRRG